MKPSNLHTSPEQRFFLPDRLEEAECHFSIDTHAIPGVHVMEGEFGYSIVETPEGEEVGYISGVDKNLSSGSLVQRVLTTGTPRDGSKSYQKDVLRPEDDLEDREKVDSPLETLELQEGDILVLEVNRNGFPKDSDLREDMDGNNVLLWPADKRLPYSGGEEQGEDSQEVRYNLMAVITHNMDLVGWNSDRGTFLRYVVDLSTANELSQNPLERAMVSHQLRISRSLLTLLRVNEAAQAYLRYFDEQKGTSFLPTEDPKPVEYHKEQMTPQQLERYRAVVEFIGGFSKSL